MIRAEGIHKHYDGVYALQNVSLDIREGEVHALMGENGAGKSTLGKIIAGVVQPDSGIIEMQGQRLAMRNSLDAQRVGIGIIFQELDLFPHLSVAENIVIRNLNVERGAFVNFGKMADFCRPFLQQVGLTCNPNTPLRSLPIGQMQLVAIARALSMKARLIVMDEPTSALSEDAVQNLIELIHELRRQGVAVLYVSHKMKEIFQIADRITVLRDGMYIGTKLAAETNIDEIITMMVGRELHQNRSSCNTDCGKVLLRVENLSTVKLKQLSFDLGVGEVLGVAGLVGAGRSELGAALFGLDKIHNGTITLAGKEIRPRNPGEAIGCGIGLLPEDRKLQGLMMHTSVKENSTMAVLGRFQRAGFVRGADELAAVKRVHARTRLKAASYTVPVSSLSGGNQQKVLLAKWLLVDPPVLFLDDPTRGIDIAAKQDIYELIEELASNGKGVIFVSSELPELLRCCNRIMVLHEGQNMGILEASEATQELIMAMATGTMV